MIFKCQEDSFLKELETTIVFCEPATMMWTPPGPNCPPLELSGYNVICENTILFPEGGGQPCDYGTLDGKSVRQVKRKDGEAVHFVETSEILEIGQKVLLRVDWERRLDHMQQHSGQHLITDLIERDFGYETLSWWLGSEDSYIELDTNHILSQESLDSIEQRANEIIRYGKEVKVALMHPIEVELRGVRAPRGIPKDVDGPIRVIQIDGQRDNMCCGTHVTNLCQLQSIKLLNAERKSKSCLVHFLVGERVLKRLSENYRREQQLTSILKGGPKQHVELLQKMQENLKQIAKSFQRLLKEVATSEAEMLNQKNNMCRLSYYCSHRRDGLEVDFIHTFLRIAPDNIPVYFMTVWDMNSTPIRGHMVLKGVPDVISQFTTQFLSLLNGKGGGGSNDGYIQGKVTNPNNIGKCEEILEKYFDGPLIMKVT